jgi:hypothetical protein
MSDGTLRDHRDGALREVDNLMGDASEPGARASQAARPNNYLVRPPGGGDVRHQSSRRSAQQLFFDREALEALEGQLVQQSLTAFPCLTEVALVVGVTQVTHWRFEGVHDQNDTAVARALTRAA